MTREEAMFYIKELQKTYASMDKKVAEAVDMAIEALKENNRSDSLVTDSSDACKESESKLDLIRRSDAVEVVRCKDCKWYEHIGCAIEIKDDSDKPKPDDFCSFGEKRGDGHD